MKQKLATLKTRFLLGLALLLAPDLAAAQALPAPTLPLTGNEQIPCIQPPPGSAGSETKGCTPAEIAAVGGGVGGSNTQVQYNCSGIFCGAQNLAVLGPTTATKGLNISGNDVNTLSAGSDMVALNLNVTNDGIGVGVNSGLAFPDANGAQDNILAWGGLASYGGLNFTKTTNIGRLTTVQVVGSGQAFAGAFSVIKSGSSDTSVLSLNMPIFNVRVRPGDEGVGLTEQSEIYQQNVEPAPTIATIPSQPTCYAHVTADVTGSMGVQQSIPISVDSGTCDESTGTYPWVVLNPSPMLPFDNQCAMKITAHDSSHITGYVCSNLKHATSTASSISGYVLTVGGTLTSTFGVGELVIGSGVAANTIITKQLSGSGGGAGTYSVSVSQTVGTEAMEADSAIRPAFVATLSSLAYAAPDLQVVDTTRSSYSTGTVSTITGAFVIDFSGTSLAPDIVGGSPVNPGCIDLHADDEDLSTVVFAGDVLHGWYPIQSVNNSTELTATRSSIAGDNSYHGNSPNVTNTYTISPCLVLLKIPNGAYPATLAVFSYDPGFNWQVGDTLEFPVGQSPDVHGMELQYQVWTPDATMRSFFSASNWGMMPGGIAFDAGDNHHNLDGQHPWAWTYGFNCAKCQTVLNSTGPQNGIQLQQISGFGMHLSGSSATDSGIHLEGDFPTGLKINYTITHQLDLLDSVGHNGYINAPSNLGADLTFTLPTTSGTFLVSGATASVSTMTVTGLTTGSGGKAVCATAGGLLYTTSSTC